MQLPTVQIMMSDIPDPHNKQNIKVLDKQTFTGPNKEEITNEARQYAIDNDHLAFDFGKFTRLRKKSLIKVEVSFFGRNS